MSGHETGQGYLPLSSAVTGKWTDEEMRYVLAQHKVMYCVDMAAALGRTFDATKNKAFRMGCSIKIKPQVSDINE